MAFEILNRILPFSKRITLRLTNDSCAGRHSGRVMLVHILDPHQNGMSKVYLAQTRSTLGNYNRSRADQKLNPMIANLESLLRMTVASGIERFGRMIRLSLA